MNDQPTYDFRNVLLLSGTILLLMFAISGYVWTQIPAGEPVCIHWNAAGECDNYGSKFVGIFLMPIITTALVGLFLLIPRIEPRASHLARSRKAYAAVWAAILLFFLAFHITIMLQLLGIDIRVVSLWPLLVGLLFVVLGRYLDQFESNFFVGIRTPWTLSSELAWKKTHRLGSRLFILEGLLIMAGALLLPGERFVYLLLGSILAIVVILVAYSYFVWRADPEAHTA